MPTLEKHVKRAPGLKSPMKQAMKDTKTEGMAKQMDYSSKGPKAKDGGMKFSPNGKTCK